MCFTSEDEEIQIILITPRLIATAEKRGRGNTKEDREKQRKRGKEKTILSM